MSGLVNIGTGLGGLGGVGGIGGGLGGGNQQPPQGPRLKMNTRTLDVVRERIGVTNVTIERARFTGIPIEVDETIEDGIVEHHQ